MAESLSRGDFLELVRFATRRGGIGSFREDKLMEYLARHSSLRIQEMEFRLPWQAPVPETVWNEEDDKVDED